MVTRRTFGWLLAEVGTAPFLGAFATAITWTGPGVAARRGGPAEPGGATLASDDGRLRPNSDSPYRAARAKRPRPTDPRRKLRRVQRDLGTAGRSSSFFFSQKCRFMNCLLMLPGERALGPLMPVSWRVRAYSLFHCKPPALVRPDCRLSFSQLLFSAGMIKGRLRPNPDRVKTSGGFTGQRRILPEIEANRDTPGNQDALSARCRAEQRTQ